MAASIKVSISVMIGLANETDNETRWNGNKMKRNAREGIALSVRGITIRGVPLLVRTSGPGFWIAHSAAVPR